MEGEDGGRGVLAWLWSMGCVGMMDGGWGRGAWAGRWVFVFQAEDGIRDLVRSRGLGDVYKRQGSQGKASTAGKAESKNLIETP